MTVTEKDVSIRVFTESMHLVRLVLCCAVLLGANPVMAADGLARDTDEPYFLGSIVLVDHLRSRRR